MPVSASDPITPIQNIFNRVENERQLFTYRWANAAARTAQTGMVSGALGYQVDLGTYWTYTGTQWMSFLGDTGWITLYNAGATMLNSFTAATAIKYRRLNGFTTMSGEVIRPTATSGSLTAFTLPTGFRPDDRIYGYLAGLGNANSNDAAYRVNINGEVQINTFALRTSAPGYNIGGIVAYPAAI